MMIWWYDDMMIWWYDDDDVDDDDDDDDDVERTRTGPYAVRSDLEHQVNHNTKISLFYHVFSSYQEGGPTGAGKTRCLAVEKRIHTNHYAVSKIAMLSQRYHEVNCRRKGSKPQARCAHVQVLIPHQALIAQALQFCFFQHVFQATNLQVPSHSCTSKWPVSYPFFKALPFFDIAWIWNRV